MSKSLRIREYVASNPAASAIEIQTALKKERIKVSMPLIYQVLAKKKNRRKRQNGNPKTEVLVESLLQAKDAVSQIGSIDGIQKALDLLAKLRL